MIRTVFLSTAAMVAGVLVSSPRRADALPRARRRDPERIAESASDLPAGIPVVAYCLYGFQVSQNRATELRNRGIDARSLAGGIAAWRASLYRMEPAEKAT